MLFLSNELIITQKWIIEMNTFFLSAIIYASQVK